MKPEPPLSEKIAALPDQGQIDGFRDQLERDGRLTPEARQLLTIRSAEVAKARKR